MYVHKVRVRFYHTDAMKVTHHANYLRWFEAARVEFFRAADISLTDMFAEGILFPILRVECDYKHASFYDDELEIRTKLVKVTRAQIVFHYEIFRPADRTVIMRGMTKGTFTSEKTRKIIRLPQHYYEKLLKYVESET